LVGSSLVLMFGQIGESHWYHWCSENFLSYYEIHLVPWGIT